MRAGDRTVEPDALRMTLEAVDAFLRAIEEVAWGARGLADRAIEGTRSAGARLRETRARSRRLAATGWSMTKLAASYRLHLTGAAFTSRRRARARLARLHERNARRLHRTAARHGGGFLKVGQLLSARPDLMPAPYVRELSRLQDAAPSFPFEQVREVVEADLGAPLSERFLRFDEEPLAAASIGQVHRAQAMDGREVAVKVRRPGVEDLIATDLDVLERFVEGMRGSLPPADYDTIVTELRAMVLAELDYVAEREAMREIAAHLAVVPGLHAPTPIDELCGDRVLTSTFVEGRKVTDALDALEPGDPAISEILGLVLEAYVRQVLDLGFFQADPHPGNLLVRPDGEVVVLDFGCAKRLDDRMRRGFVGLMQSFMAQDRERMGELFDELGFETRSGDPATLHRFADAMLGELRAVSAAGAVAWPEPEEMLRKVQELLRAAEGDPVVRIPCELVMLGRVFGTLGGLFLTYRPEVDYARHVLPTLARAMAG